MTEDLVGQVVGTEDATPLQFNVALREGAYLQLDDVVVTIREVPGVGPVMTSALDYTADRHMIVADGGLPPGFEAILDVARGDPHRLRVVDVGEVRDQRPAELVLRARLPAEQGTGKRRRHGGQSTYRAGR